MQFLDNLNSVFGWTSLQKCRFNAQLLKTCVENSEKSVHNLGL
jgi:hypothetical protein